MRIARRKLRESILHFAARSVMNIEGMGESLVNQLTERGLVKNIADIYALDKGQAAGPGAYRREIGGQPAAPRLSNRRKLPLERVIFGLGIRLVGERTAEFLAEHFGSMDALMNAIRGRTAGGE